MPGPSVPVQIGTVPGADAQQFWEIPAPGWRRIVERAWREAGGDNIGLLAAGVAFYSFLTFVPMLAAIVLLYGLIAAPAQVADHIAALTHVMPADAAHIIADQMKSMTATPVSRTTIGLIIAILLALYGAMRGATSVIGALNIAYGEKETRSFVRTTGLSFAFTLGAVLSAIVAMLAISVMTLMGTAIRLPPVAAPLVTGGLWIVTALVMGGLVAVVYRFGPDREDARWSWLVPGAAFASVGALFATLLFGFYVSHFASYNATYGALGTVVSFLMWLYVASYVLLLGAELNAEIERQTGRDTTVGPEVAIGERGAAMADTMVSAMPSDSADAITPGSERPIPTRSSRLAPVAAGVAATAISRVASDAPIGVIPTTLLAAGLTMVGRRRSLGRGMLFLAGGGLLIWRARSRGGEQSNRSTALSENARDQRE